MSIGIRCTSCRSGHKLSFRKCKCGANLLKHMSYKVRVKMPNGKWRSHTTDS